jgi:hypothetical protein
MGSINVLNAYKRGYLKINKIQISNKEDKLAEVKEQKLDGRFMGLGYKKKVGQVDEHGSYNGIVRVI